MRRTTRTRHSTPRPRRSSPSPDVKSQRTATKKLAGLLLRDTPVITAYFNTYVTAASSKVKNYQVESLFARAHRPHLPRLGFRANQGCRLQLRQPYTDGSRTHRTLRPQALRPRADHAPPPQRDRLRDRAAPARQLGRSVLGPYATEEAVAAYNHEHGTDRLCGRPVRRLGERRRARRSRRLARTIGPDRLEHPRARAPQLLKLAIFAFVLVVPFGILGGVFAGLRVGRPTDRAITVVGLSLAVVPEFVTGLVLILVFSIWARLAARDGAVGTGRRGC